MDAEYQRQLEERLAMERRLLHADRMTQARVGLYGDPSLIIRIEDREKEIRQIEALLGTVYHEPPARRYERVSPRPTYRPEPDLAQQRFANTQHHVKLLGIHRTNLTHYQRQARAYGNPDLAPPITQHGIREAREGIAKEKYNLRMLGVPVEDFEGE